MYKYCNQSPLTCIYATALLSGLTITLHLFSNLLFLVAPANLTNVTQDQTVPEGTNLELFCEASGSPVPTITWVQVFQDGSVSEVKHTGPTWHFTDITYAKRGTYRCTAANGIGSPVSHKITLNVLCK